MNKEKILTEKEQIIAKIEEYKKDQTKLLNMSTDIARLLLENQTLIAKYKAMLEAFTIMENAMEEEEK